MKIKMCVNNLDLFAKGTDEDLLRKLLLGKSNIDRNKYELDELHCLGYCYWCQQGPMALVDGCLINKTEK